MQLLDKNCIYIKSYFEYLHQNANEVPCDLINLMMINGFSLKSASLIIQTLSEKPIMVAVDRHLHRCLKSMQWVHPNSSSDIETSIHVGHKVLLNISCFCKKQLRPAFSPCPVLFSVFFFVC